MVIISPITNNNNNNNNNSSNSNKNNKDYDGAAQCGNMSKTCKCVHEATRRCLTLEFELSSCMELTWTRSWSYFDIG